MFLRDRLTRISPHVALVCACAVAGLSCALAQGADRIANIRKAAAEIAKVVATKGAKQAFVQIGECYQSQLPAKSLTLMLEGCLAQDVILSKASAAFFGKIGKAGRRALHSPDPKAMTDAMLQRVSATFRRLNVPDQAATELGALIEKYGVEAYKKAESSKAAPVSEN